MSRRPRWAALATLAWLAACAPPGASGTPRVPFIDGQFDILGPTPDLVAAGLPGEWARQGPARPGQARVVERDGVPALRLVPGGDGFLLARRLDAPLFVTPYLSWSWNMDDHGVGLHPIRLIVGFHSGAATAGTVFEGRGVLPPHDRSFAVAWADSALRRGALVKSDATAPRAPVGAHDPERAGIRPRAPLYIARGGRENTAAWWLETIDLQYIYRELWPFDDPMRVRVAFVGLAAAATSGEGPAAHISGIRLAR